MFVQLVFTAPSTDFSKQAVVFLLQIKYQSEINKLQALFAA
jgi:hypothetical protein